MEQTDTLISIDGNVFICSQGLYRAVTSDRDLTKLVYCVQEEILNVARMRLQGTLYYIYFGGVGTGVSDFLMSHLSDVHVPRTFVTYSLYRTALPFLCSMGMLYVSQSIKLQISYSTFR
jgi:hypothetical protein